MLGGVATTGAETVTDVLAVEVRPLPSVAVKAIVKVPAAVGVTLTVEPLFAPAIVAPVAPGEAMLHRYVAVCPVPTIDAEAMDTGWFAIGVTVVIEMSAHTPTALPAAVAATAARASSIPAPQSEATVADGLGQ